MTWRGQKKKQSARVEMGMPGWVEKEMLRRVELGKMEASGGKAGGAKLWRESGWLLKKGFIHFQKLIC